MHHVAQIPVAHRSGVSAAADQKKGIVMNKHQRDSVGCAVALGLIVAILSVVMVIARHGLWVL